MSGDLGSAPVPPPGERDHCRDGDGPGAILYVDLACPLCASEWALIRDLRLALCVRHFPLESKRPRSPALHAAAEAAAEQGGEEAFWGMWDSLLEDRGHVDDPHLWQRAERLGLDLDRFESDRRSERVRDRIGADFRSGIRGGVTGTPAAFVGGRLISVRVPAALKELADL